MSRNATCFTPKAPQKGPSLFQHGTVVFQAHDVGWIISGVFTIVAITASFWLINKHLQWYTNKAEQRYIIRLLLMVPIYASISLASYLFWDNATPLLLIRDAYEAILLTAFFYLLLTYLSPDPEEQKSIFRKRGLSREADAELRRRGLPRRKWVFPLGFVRWKPQDGLFFLQLMKWGVLQYSVVRPTTTLVAVILNHIGLYCEQSWSPAWGHIYISTIISISVTIAMYCLLQLYFCVSTELAPHRPVLKLVSVKAVVFLTFWQATFLSLLSMFGVVRNTPYMTAEDINIGWGAIIETFEMSIFAFVHIKAFTYKPYRPLTPNSRRTPRLRSFAHAMDFRETFRELYAGAVYMWRRMRGAETDPLARRIAVFENAFEKERAEGRRGRPGEVRERVVEVDTTVEVAVDGERQWLGITNDHCYGLSRRERSEALGVQVEKELEKRGYGGFDPDPDAGLGQSHSHDRKHRSWWRRSAYDRVSQSISHNAEARASSSAKRKSRSRPTSRDAAEPVRVYDDQPPPSILKTYRDHRASIQALPPGAMPPQISTNMMSEDVLGLPMQDRYPSLPVNANIARADTVLDRLFSGQPARSDAGHTSLSGSGSVVSPSSQSHRTHLPLHVAPIVLPRDVAAGRPVEVTSPNSKDAQELHVEQTVLPIAPIAALLTQPPQERSDPESPPLPPPKDTRGSLHRRELAHFQTSPPQVDSSSTPMVPAVPAPSAVSDLERSTIVSRTEQSLHARPLANVRELRKPQTSSADSHRPPRPRVHKAVRSGDRAPHPRSRASVGVASPTHTFSPIPESSRRLRQKGTPHRINGGMPTRGLPFRHSPSPLNYSVYALPNARSPPSAPLADQTLSRYQDLRR